MKKNIFLFTIAILLSNFISAQVGFWTKVTNNPPDASGGVCILLSDGTVMAKNETGGSGGIGNGWNRLTPDASGSYINGTWSTLASMINTRLYFSSQVLKDGRIYVAGGEYGTGKSLAEMYNPLTNTWTALPNPGGVVSDANSEILPDGRVLQAMVNGSLKTTLIYNPILNTYIPGPSSIGIHNESAWVKLTDNSILQVDRNSTNSERYIPATNTWTADATVPVALYDPFGLETGSALLLPDGRAWFMGSPPNTAYYTPSGSTTPGTWTAGANIPGNNGAVDAASNMMMNGKILCAASPSATSGNVFKSPTYFYEFDYLTNSFATVTPPGGGTYTNQPVYVFNMLNLPNGQVLLSRQDTNVYYIYTPNGSPLAAGVPTVSNISQNGCNTFTVTGKLFNGITQASTYGDDWQNATNYPIVRLTSGSNVYYCRTSNWNSTGVRRGNLADTAQFTTPLTLPVGVYTLVVIANGNPSLPQTFIPVPFLSSSLTPPAVCSGKVFNYTPTSLVGLATFSWTRPAVAGISNAAVTIAQAGNPGETLINTTASTITVTYNYTTAAKGCSYPQNVTVVVNPSPTLAISGTNTMCAGGNTTLTVSGATSYTWNTSATTTTIIASPFSTTTFSVIGTNSFACSSTQQTTVTVYTLPSIFVTGPTLICTGNSATLTANGGNTYLWNTSSTNTSIVVNPTVNTNYSVTGTDVNGCSDVNSISITVSACTGITEITSLANGAIVYPNPADELATLSFNAGTSGSYSVVLMDVFGRTILNQNAEAKVGTNAHEITLTGISKGVYFIILQKGNESFKTKLVVR